MAHFMKLSLGSLAILALLNPLTYAETTGWQTQIESNLGITQSQYSDNWLGAASGFAWVSSMNAQTQKQMNPSLHWKHTLKLAFGQTHTQDQVTKNWFIPVKSNDQIDYETVLKLTRGWWVDPVISGRIETQFLDKSIPTETRNFNPLKISETVGMARTLYKGEKSGWDVRLGIVARQLFNDLAVNAVNPLPHRLTIYDGGVQLDSDFKAPLNDRLSFASKLTLNQALLNSQSDDLTGQTNKNYWQALDVYWDNTLTGKLASYLSMQLNAQFLYDKEVALGGRFKETLSLGLTYVFQS